MSGDYKFHFVKTYRLPDYSVKSSQMKTVIVWGRNITLRGLGDRDVMQVRRLLEACVALT